MYGFMSGSSKFQVECDLDDERQEDNVRYILQKLQKQRYFELTRYEIFRAAEGDLQTMLKCRRHYQSLKNMDTYQKCKRNIKEQDASRAKSIGLIHIFTD